MTGGIDGENQQYVGFNAAWTNRQAEFSTKNGMIIRSATHRDKTTNYIVRNHSIIKHQVKHTKLRGTVLTSSPQNTSRSHRTPVVDAVCAKNKPSSNCLPGN
jgi:hypothetical protein